MINYLEVVAIESPPDKLTQLGMVADLLLESGKLDQLPIFQQAIHFGNITFYNNKTSKELVGVIAWGRLTDLVIDRIVRHNSTQLHPSEWNEGDRLFVLSVAAPMGNLRHMIAYFRKQNGPFTYYRKNLRHY